MYISIRHYDDVTLPDEAVAKVRKEFLPIISKIPGFQDYYAIKTGDGRVASVSIFKDKPGADSSVRAASQWVQKNMSRYLPNPPQVINGETIAHTSGRPGKAAA